MIDAASIGDAGQNYGVTDGAVDGRHVLQLHMIDKVGFINANYGANFVAFGHNQIAVDKIRF